MSMTEAEIREKLEQRKATKKRMRQQEVPTTTVRTQRELEEEAILEKLAELGGQRVHDDDLVFQGTRLIIPETMTAQGARDFLKQHIDQAEQVTNFQRTFKYRPWDGAMAFSSAVKHVFGTAGLARSSMSFFGPTPPELRTINVSLNNTAQVPWGDMLLPMIEGKASTRSVHDPDIGALFSLYIEAPRKYRTHIEGLFRVIEEELKLNSIYRGKAIDGAGMPNFLDLSTVDPARVIYSAEVERQLEAMLWSLIRHTDVQRRLELPLKRTVLLEGPYGTGKTLAAFLTAQIAVEHGWTFIYCRPGQDDLDSAIGTARLYPPAVVFCEDVDRISDTTEENRSSVPLLLDLLDGINAKGTELVAVMTTNHPDRITKAMARPGRLDAVIHVETLDTDGVMKMICVNVPAENRADNLDFERIQQAMQDYTPAFIKECIDRAIRYGLARNQGVPDVLTTEDFVAAASGLRPQLNLMLKANEIQDRDPLSTVLVNEVRRSLHGARIDQAASGPVFNTEVLTANNS